MIIGKGVRFNMERAKRVEFHMKELTLTHFDILCGENLDD